MLCTYYRGRSSFLDMMHLPLSYINQLYLIAEQREKTKEGQERREGEVLEDELEEAMV
jgi:hypothetical protein